MVNLGPKWVGASRPRLHDAPLGYHPPRLRIPLKERQRESRQQWLLMRVATVVLVAVVAAFLVLLVVLIATHI
jgi:hypothetical protein